MISLRTALTLLMTPMAIAGTMMLLGPGMTTDRVIGGFDDGYYGLDIDQASGELASGSGNILSAESVGASLLALAGMDPGEFISDASPIEGILS